MRARKIILAADRGTDPLEPDNAESICKGCEHGYPTIYELGGEYIIDDERLPVVSYLGYDGEDYHSLCGDRFVWTPPHEKSTQ